MGKKSVSGKQKIIHRNKNTDWISNWTALFIGGYLLFSGFSGYSSISGTKTVLFYALCLLLLVLGGLYLIQDHRAGRTLRLTPAQIAALGFWGFTLLSAACSPYANAWYDSTAHEAALTVSLYVLLFLVVSRWGDPTDRHFQILFWSLAAFCLICLLQFFGGNPLWLYPGDLNFYDGFGVRYKGAYAGTIGNVDLVSAFLALVVPMLLIRSRKLLPRKAWHCWALAVACFLILLWVRVLCGLVGLALGGLICFSVLCPDRWRRWVLLSVALLALSALAVLWFFDLPVGFLHELHEILHGRIEDSFGTGRFFIWRQMAARIPDRLWLGVGPDMTRYSGLSPFVRFDEGGNLIARATITDAHCYPLQILYCQGLPALLSWLTMMGVALTRWFQNREDRVAALLGGGLICFLFAMLFCISSVVIMPFFWLTLGLLEARTTRIKKGDSYEQKSKNHYHPADRSIDDSRRSSRLEPSGRCQL